MKVGLYVGTVGTAMWSSGDLGESWYRPSSEAGLYMESRIWSLTSQPYLGQGVIAGTDCGVYRWHSAQRKWEHFPSQLDAVSTYTIAQSPHDPNVMLAGTRPAALYRSTDGGRSWTDCGVKFAPACAAVIVPRVTAIAFDPQDPEFILVAAEIDGIYRSRDGGRTWERTVKGLLSEDLHGLALIRQDGRRKLFAVTNKGLHVSRDDGDTWAHQPIPGGWIYFRSLVPKADTDRVLFLTNGDGPPGSTGRLLRSDDYGESWSEVVLPEAPNSTPWCVAVHPLVPEVVFVSTGLGQVFRSKDGGRSWDRLKRQFGEIRALALRPMDDKAPVAGTEHGRDPQWSLRNQASTPL